MGQEYSIDRSQVAAGQRVSQRPVMSGVQVDLMLGAGRRGAGVTDLLTARSREDSGTSTHPLSYA
jgi:hypothetical protein